MNSLLKYFNHFRHDSAWRVKVSNEQPTNFSWLRVMGKPLRFVLVAALTLFALQSQAAYVQVYSTIQKGALTFTGNTLALDGDATAGNLLPGTSATGGAFAAANLSTYAGGFNAALYGCTANGTSCPGTTVAWASNASRAVLNIPAGATVLYAELIWLGTATGPITLGVYDNQPVNFTTPLGSTYSITPSTTTKQLYSNNYYTRSANVTGLVQIGGSGTYTVGGVPSNVDTSGTTDAAGWALAVAYADPSKPACNLTIFVGAEPSGAAAAEVSGFCTPVSGPVNGRLLVSAVEGDSSVVGDTMLFGPTAPLNTTTNRLSGPNNPISNFFNSQINSDTGTLNTSGSFGAFNNPPGGNLFGGRQGYDITNVDASSFLTNSQTTAFAQGTTTGDVYAINALGMQINVTSPVFPVSVKNVNKASTLVEVITYVITYANRSGVANVTINDVVPAYTLYVGNSAGCPNLVVRTVCTVPIEPANNAAGSMQWKITGNLAARASGTVQYQVRVEQ